MKLMSVRFKNFEVNFVNLKVKNWNFLAILSLEKSNKFEIRVMISINMH
jgi:hypothetical protein